MNHLDDFFLLGVYLVVFMTVLAIGGGIVELWNWYQERANNKKTMAKFVNYRDYQKRGR